MRLPAIILCVVCACSPMASADETLKRVFADWKAIREADDVYKFVYSYTRQNFTSKEEIPAVKGEFTIHWPSQAYRKQQWQRSTHDGNPITIVEVYAEKMRSMVTWPINADATVGKTPVRATISKGDFTATQFDQDLFPFLLAKRVVLSRPRDNYRPGEMRFEPDESLFYVHSRAGTVVTLNTYPKSAGPSRSFWQYDVDLGKQSAIRVLRSMQQRDGKADVVFVEWRIEYSPAGSDWAIVGWVERQYDVSTGKVMNRHDMKVTSFEKTSAAPAFMHEIPAGQKVESVTYPEYNPSAREHRIVETIEYQPPERTRTRVYLTIAGAILGFLVLAAFARRLLKPRSP